VRPGSSVASNTPAMFKKDFTPGIRWFTPFISVSQDSRILESLMIIIAVPYARALNPRAVWTSPINSVG